MKPKPIDRLLTILLGVNLLYALWWIVTTFPAQAQTAANVF
jgi:hypothetical protein